MKSRAVLLVIGLLISCSFVSGQVSKDTLRKDSVYPQFYDSFSAEESWQIHKEAYRKQLEAKGLSGDEINKNMKEYEKRKEEFIERMIEQRKQAEEQRKLAEVQRQKADEQRKEAEAQRQEAEKMRLEAGEMRKQAGIEREKAEEQRKQAEIQREKAGEMRKQAGEQRKSAEIQRQKAEEQRKEAGVQREKAAEERRIAEEWRNSIQRLLSENFTIAGKDSEPKVIRINVTESSSLFFNLNGEISSGTVMIEIFNPSGKKEGEFSLEHLNVSSTRTETISSGTSSGSLNKTINSPEIGEWSIKIKPEKSDCHINISVAQYKKPTIDE